MHSYIVSIIVRDLLNINILNIYIYIYIFYAYIYAYIYCNIYYNI